MPTHSSAESSSSWPHSPQENLCLFKRQGGLSGDREGQHSTSPEIEHLNNLTIVEVGF